MMKMIMLIGIATASIAAQADCVTEVMRLGDSGREVAESACRRVSDAKFGEQCLYWAVVNPYESVPGAMRACKEVETQEMFSCMKDYVEKNGSDAERAHNKCDPDYVDPDDAYYDRHY